jgi:membrane protein DedA with SNARE-associated domain
LLTEVLEFVRHAIEAIITFLGYPGIALVMLLENLFPPIPSELVMPFAGFQVAQGKMNMIGAIAAGTLGALIGAVALYYIGYWADEPVVRTFIRRYGRFFLLSEDDLDRALAFFTRFGPPVVFFGRLIPIIRSLISIPAGMNKMPLPTFLLFTTLGTLIWNSVLAYAGMVLGANWDHVLVFVKQYERLVMVVGVVAVVGFLVYRIIQMRSNPVVQPSQD